MTANNCFLVEDHHEALRIWREKKVKNLDLVHIDAHLDFGFHAAKPIKQVMDEAKSVKDLKASLEQSLAFIRYERDFEKQTNIGNYIYPAMREGIVRDFYWVIPGGAKEFKESSKQLKILVRALAKKDPHRAKDRDQSLKVKEQKNAVSTFLMGRRFIITTLEHLPILNNKVLLDIDIDYFVVNSLKNANASSMVGKRKPWIQPEKFVDILREKVKTPQLVIIAYSVNGGFTPMRYKYLGDEVAYCLAPQHFEGQFKQKCKAAKYFNLFCSTGKKRYYQRAVKISPAYRAADNSYGPLYLSLRKFSRAEDEFLKVLRADSKNPAPLCGLGNIALERKNFTKAKRYFSAALKSENNKIFDKAKKQSLFGLARAEFALKNFKRAKKLLFHYQTLEPFQPQSYYLLGRIFEKEKDFKRSATFYQDALRLGFNPIEPISQLLKMSPHLEEDGIIAYIIAKYNEFKKVFIRTKKLSLKKGKKVKGLHKIEKKIAVLEKRLQKAASCNFTNERRYKSYERDSRSTQKSRYGNKSD